LAERILSALTKPFHVGQEDLTVSASIGIAVQPPDGDDPSGLLARAESAMHLAKAKGRSSYRFYNETLTATVTQRVHLEHQLREALARRGIEGDQVELVHIEPWTVGSFEQGPRRMARCLAWLRSSLDDVNPYGRPLGGLVALVDLTEMRVVRIDDHGTLPVPDGDWDYRDGGGDGYRDDQRPIEITQPDGPSFTLRGRELRWQKWRLRVGFSHRESLVLHEICYEQDGEVRPICHRASIAELVIPYGDPNPTVHFKNAFDIGEFGLGPLVNALELGCDCLGEIRYLDAWVNDSRGGATASKSLRTSRLRPSVMTTRYQVLRPSPPPLA